MSASDQMANSARQGVSLTAMRLALARGLARIPIAVLPLVIVATYGAAPQTDSFFLVLAAVQFVVNSFAPLFETVVVPFIAEHRRTSADAAFARSVLGRVLSYVAPLSITIAAAGLLWRSSGLYQDVGWENGWKHLVVLACVPAFNALASILAGYLNAEEWFLWSAFAGSVRGLVALAIGVTLGSRLGIFAYALGIAAGEAAALGWMLMAAPCHRILKARPADDALVRPFWTLYGSTVFGGLANSSKGFVDRLVVTSVGPGAVSILEAAERLFLMAVSFCGAPLATVVLSRWSTAFQDGQRRDQLRAALARARWLSLLLGVAILLAYPVITTPPVWSRLFARFSSAEVPVAKLALLMYLSGAVPYLLGLVSTQAILVLRDSFFVASVAIVIGILNVPLDLIFVRLLGLPGIALASSVLHLVGWLAAEWRLRRRMSGTTLIGAGT